MNILHSSPREKIKQMFQVGLCLCGAWVCQFWNISHIIKRKGKDESKREGVESITHKVSNVTRKIPFLQKNIYSRTCYSTAYTKILTTLKEFVRNISHRHDFRKELTFCYWILKADWGHAKLKLFYEMIYFLLCLTLNIHNHKSVSLMISVPKNV